MSVNVDIGTISAVKKFVSISSNTELTVDVGEGKYIVDGKSILGVFSLDLSRPVKVEIDGDADKIQEYLKDIEEFIVK